MRLYALVERRRLAEWTVQLAGGRVQVRNRTPVRRPPLLVHGSVHELQPSHGTQANDDNNEASYSGRPTAQSGRVGALQISGLCIVAKCRRGGAPDS
jgi:hypothetical protein